MMKVALVGPTYPHRGGIAHYTSLLAVHLGKEHAVRVYGFRTLYPSFLFPGASELDPSPNALVDVLASRWLTPWLPTSWRKVARDWKDWQVDLVVMQWWVPWMFPMTAWLSQQARALNIPLAMICHNILPHERSRLDAWLARRALSQADTLIVHSPQDRSLLLDLLPGANVHVVPHPSYGIFKSLALPRERARAELNVTGNVLLFFGIVRPYKGLLDLIDALPCVLEKIPVTLLVVGEIWGKRKIYFQRAKELGMTSHVRFVSRYVSNAEAATYFSAADLAVLPYRETTGSGVLQFALGFGVPVVATRTGGAADVVVEGETGFLVDPGNVNDLARAIVRFFAEDRAAPMRAAIQARQAQYGWDALAQAVLQPALARTKNAAS